MWEPRLIHLGPGGGFSMVTLPTDPSTIVRSVEVDLAGEISPSMTYRCG